MKEQKLRYSKNKVYVFIYFKTFDKTNGNTIKALKNAYWIENNKRHYFTNYLIKGYKEEKLKPVTTYESGIESAWKYLNKYTNFNIKYICDLQNVVAFDEEITHREFNRITK